MSDPLAPVQPDQPMPLGADTWNAMLDAARAHKLSGREGGGAPDNLIVPSLEVIIRNDSGSNLSAGHILRITDWAISPVSSAREHEVRRRPFLVGSTPNASTNLIAILSEPIKNGQYGAAVVQGIAVCDVLINDAAHTYAEPINSLSTRLSSVDSGGAARIIARETGTGLKRAIVLLDATLSGTAEIYGRADSSPALPGEGPRATINLLSDPSGLLLVEVADDAGDNELEFQFTFAGINARVYSGSDLGPQTKLNFLRYTYTVGNNLEITGTDDVGDGEIELEFKNLGTFVRPNGGTTVGPQPRLNFVNATGISWAAANDAGNEEIDITPTLAITSSIISDFTTAVLAIIATFDIDSGVYTPTVTGVANVDSTGAFESQWQRIGDIVQVTGRISVDATAAATATIVRISLPVASNLANTDHLNGLSSVCLDTSGATPITEPTTAGIIFADTTNNEAILYFTPASNASRQITFAFGYEVI